MKVTRSHAAALPRARNMHWLIGAAVAAAISGTFATSAVAADAAKADEKKEETAQIEEIQVTGSRIVRKDMSSNSPLVTVDRTKLDDNTYISIEQALNELPQFMAGGSGLGAFGSQTGIGTLGGMEQLDGGAGSGTMFDNARLPDTGGRIGTYTPGAANVNLRGLGSNRSLTLIDGHRGQPTNATGTVDLNTIPSAAIANIEVITGGASAVYGADALAGVTNIKLRDNFEGLNVRLRGGMYEVGDGGEYQVSSVMGTRIADKGHALIGIEYSKREVSLYRNRSWFREAMESPYSSFANASFQPYDYFTASNSNLPSAAAVASVFPNASLTGCTNASGTVVPCVARTGGGGGFFFNPDGTLFTRSSSCYLPTATTTTCATAPGGAAPGSTTYFGPQHFKGSTVNTRDNPNEIACAWAANQPNSVYTDRSCNPTLTNTDWDRWMGSPREAYTLFGNAKYEINDHVSAYSTINFATSTTSTRREASPASGGFAANVPFYTTAGGGAAYLPSIQQTDVVRNGVVVRAAGSTLPEYQVGGVRGTNCPATGGCTMAQAFPVPVELRTILESRNPTSLTRALGGTAATNPYAGLSTCVNYARDPNAVGTGAAPGQLTSANGVAVTYQIDPNTGQPVYTCGPNATWAYNTRFDFIPPRGTINTQRTWSLAAGLTGDLPFSDWTWDLYTSKGQGQTNTEFQGFVSLYNYRLIMSQPNYGRGYINDAGSAKTLSCTSGLSPFSNEPISQDCIDAVASNQFDRSGTDQRVHEFSMQGHLFDLPAGDARAALGASYRKNTYFYTPDSLRERDYINDTSAGQFGIGSIDAGMSVKEVYGELLIPLLKDLPLVQNLELELGGRWSKYSTGQGVPTWKALMSWTPVSWVRARGGYNRAERAPNIAELYTAASANASGAGSDPCIVPSTNAIASLLAGTSSTPINTVNDALNPNRAKLQALCAAQIAAAGGTGNSEYDADPNNFGRTTLYNSGITIVSGNPNLKSEKGQTWTMGLVVSSPFAHPLLSRLSTTVDWYEARIDDPIEIPPGGIVSWACFNGYGDNPDYLLDDPNGYCKNIERDPVVGNIRFTSTPYLNRGKLVMRGLDASVNWAASMSDLGLENVPGQLSIGVNANFLFDQIQAVQAGGTTRDYAGIGGAAPFRSSTTVGYSWDKSRVSVNWQYRSGTCIAVFGALGCDASRSRYPISNQFSITGGTKIGIVNASLSVSNPLNTKPRVGTYQFIDPTQGYGTFSPFDDVTGRRWSMNLSMDF
jgi:outer membrane receptor protein involved in Fe transport